LPQALAVFSRFRPGLPDGALVPAMALRFTDHEGFHRAAVLMVGAGLAAGALASLLPQPIPPALAGGMIGAAVGVGLAHGRMRPRLVAAVLALVAFRLVLAVDVWAALAASAAVGAVGLTVGERSRRPLAMMLGGAALFAASWAALRISYAEQTASWPAWLSVGLGSAALAFGSVLALVPPRLRWVKNAIANGVRLLPAGLDAEVRDLCDRSVALWESAKDKSIGASEKELLRDGVERVLEVAHRTASSSAAPAGDADLDHRIELLDRRIAAASDQVTRDQYQAARGALDDQERLRDRMRQGRERIVARLHNHVATLERFHLAAQNLESTRASTDAPPSVAGLTQLSADVATSSEALAELELAAPSAPASALPAEPAANPAAS
jgi:hypothetical protein